MPTVPQALGFAGKGAPVHATAAGQYNQGQGGQHSVFALSHFQDPPHCLEGESAPAFRKRSEGLFMLTPIVDHAKSAVYPLLPALSPLTTFCGGSYLLQKTLLPASLLRCLCCVLTGKRKVAEEPEFFQPAQSADLACC